MLVAGFFQEISGLPDSLQSLRLHRNVVYVRLLGKPDFDTCSSSRLSLAEQLQFSTLFGASCWAPPARWLRRRPPVASQSV